MRRTTQKEQAIKQLERVYYTTQVLFWLAVSLPIALSVLLMQNRGLDLLQIGVLTGVFSLTVVLCEFPSGALADTIGRKKITLLAYLFMVLAHAVFLVSFTFVGLLVSWVLMGIGRAFASGALHAWFIDSLLELDPKLALQPSLAKAGTFELLALTLGTLGGSYLPNLVAFLPQDGTAILTPLAVPVVVSIGVKLLLIAFVALAVKDPAAREATTPQLGFGRLPQVVREAVGLSRHNGTILLLLVATLAPGFVVAGLESFWQPHFAGLLGGHEGNTVLFGVIMAGCFFMGMLGNLASIPLSRLLGQRYALVAGVSRGFSGLLLIVLAAQAGVVSAVGVFWLVYLTSAIALSPHSALFNREVPKEQRATMLSLESLVRYGGAFAGSVVLGYLAEAASTGVAWTVAGTVLVLSIAAYLRVDANEARVSRHVQEEPRLPLEAERA